MGHCLKGKQDVILQVKIMGIQHQTSQCCGISLQGYLTIYLHWKHTGDMATGTKVLSTIAGAVITVRQTKKKQTAVVQDV